MNPFSERQALLDNLYESLEAYPDHSLEGLVRYASKPNRYLRPRGSSFYPEHDTEHLWPNIGSLAEGEPVKCRKCGLKGNVAYSSTLFKFGNEIGILVRKDKRCETKLMHSALQPEYIQLTSVLPTEFNIPRTLLGIHKTVLCPFEYLHVHPHRAWISNAEGKAVLLHPSEYIVPDPEVVKYFNTLVQESLG